MKPYVQKPDSLFQLASLGLCLLFSSCASMLSNVGEVDSVPSDYNKSTVGGSYPFSSELEEDAQKNSKWSQPKGSVPVAQGFQASQNQLPRRMKKEDFIDQSRADGSLWSSDGQSNYFFTKNKIRNRGDLITITADETLVRDVADEIKRNLSEDEQEVEMELSNTNSPSRQPSSQRTADEKKEDIADPKTAAAEEPKVAAEKDPDKINKKSNWRTLDLRPAIEFKSGDPLMVEVLDRYPNGNYKVKGMKRIRHRGQVRVVEILAIAKGTDINDDDQIAAGKLYEYRLTSMQ